MKRRSALVFDCYHITDTNYWREKFERGLSGGASLWRFKSCRVYRSQGRGSRESKEIRVIIICRGAAAIRKDKCTCFVRYRGVVEHIVGESEKGEFNASQRQPRRRVPLFPETMLYTGCFQWHWEPTRLRGEEVKEVHVASSLSSCCALCCATQVGNDTRPSSCRHLEVVRTRSLPRGHRIDCFITAISRLIRRTVFTGPRFPGILQYSSFRRTD